MPEVANPTSVHKANQLQYLTAQTRIKIRKPSFLFSHHEEIHGMSCYTKNMMIDMIRWSTPTVDYNPAKRETDKTTLYQKTGTPHDFNKRWAKAGKYLMGEDTVRQKSLFQMTIQQNIDCLIQLGSNIRAFNMDNIPQNQATDLLHSLEYAILGY